MNYRWVYRCQHVDREGLTAGLPCGWWSLDFASVTLHEHRDSVTSHLEEVPDGGRMST